MSVPSFLVFLVAKSEHASQDYFLICIVGYPFKLGMWVFFTYIYFPFFLAL